ncbi:MAG: rhamnulokinase [Candidatus Sulfotelmatobacter sp.]
MSDSAANTYLAFDLGAESGRAVIGRLQSGILTAQEIHRFPNEPVNEGGSLRWDVRKLWSEIRKSLDKVRETPLTSIGVDAWGVDYALLDANGELLHNPFHYRDCRTEGAMEEVLRKVPKEEIYRATGIQFMPINTLYQLYAERRGNPEAIASAKHLVTIPDLFNYWLTGNITCEFTNATTTQMVDPVARNWANDLMARLGLPSSLPATIVEPGSTIGSLLTDLVPGNSPISVIAPACHDTGSAVAAISAREGTAFISSGTWSLVGIELDAPVITPDSLLLNFTNEGGVCGTTRLLKNIMGLWMLQGCRQSWAAQRHPFEYRPLMDLAAQEPPFRHLVDPDDESFLHPADMLEAIRSFCRKTQQPLPETPAAFVRAILESLAFKYRLVLGQLEALTGTKIEQIRVVGGGSKNSLLNQMTADATGRRVLAGPAEATALGNIAVQIIATGGSTSLSEARGIIDRSFPTVIFEPREIDRWECEAERFEHYCERTYA